MESETSSLSTFSLLVLANTNGSPSSSAELNLDCDTVKRSYDWLKSVEELAKRKTDSSLPQLLVQGFDEEQIWQQLNIQNICKLKKFLKLLRSSGSVRLLPLPDRHSDNNQRENEGKTSHSETPIEVSVIHHSPGSCPENEEQVSDLRLKGQGRNAAETEVDDQFFKLKEMEEFLLAEELKEENNGNESLHAEDDIDHFNEVMSDEDPLEIRYSSFFDMPGSQEAEEEELSQDGQASDDWEFGTEGSTERVHSGEGTSKLEARNFKLKKVIEDLEEQNLAPKAWQMVGEVSGTKRPENALLAEHLAYDTATRLPPVITQDTTEQLENLIRQRIKDKQSWDEFCKLLLVLKTNLSCCVWDDVERKENPKEEPRKYRNELILDQEKSKISLSQVYEQEFLKQAKKEKAEMTNPKYVDIKKDMKELFEKLDALSNYHYAPKPPAAEIKIVKNVRSLEMEEVAPITVNDRSLLTAEEIKPALRGGEPKHESEKGKTEKKRELRKKKQWKRKKAHLKLEKQNGIRALEKVGKVRKAKTTLESKQRTKSTDFFNKMQKEASDRVRSVATSKDSRNAKKTTSGSARYKL